MNGGATPRLPAHPALLLLNIGPVRELVWESLTTSDLLAGSRLLSHIMSRVLAAISREAGDHAILFPGRPHPAVPLPGLGDGGNGSAASCLPNHIVALVESDRTDLPGIARRAAAEAWNDIAAGVHKTIAARAGAEFPGWDVFWNPQVSRIPTAEAILVPLENGCDGFARAQALFEGLRRTRMFDAWPGGPVAKDPVNRRDECLGGRTQSDCDAFWRRMKNEWFPSDFTGRQFCGALSAIKRLHPRTGQPAPHVAVERPPETSLADRIDASIEGRDRNPCRYAVIAFDVDGLDEHLSTALSGGASLPTVFPDSLAAFSRSCVPSIVEIAKGLVIHSGGDHTLVVTPVSSALDCARDLALALQGLHPEPALRVPNLQSSGSAGIAIADTTVPLQDVIRAARECLAAARQAHRKGAFGVRVLTHPGDASSFTANWSSGAIDLWRELASDPHGAKAGVAKACAQSLTSLLAATQAGRIQFEPVFTPQARAVVTAELRHLLIRDRCARDDADALASLWISRLLGDAPAAAGMTPLAFSDFWRIHAFLRRHAAEEIT